MSIFFFFIIISSVEYLIFPLSLFLHHPPSPAFLPSLPSPFICHSAINIFSVYVYYCSYPPSSPPSLSLCLVSLSFFFACLYVRAEGVVFAKGSIPLSGISIVQYYFFFFFSKKKDYSNPPSSFSFLTFPV